MVQSHSLLPLAVLLSLSNLGSEARPINHDLLNQYDYIIVGGGASGLTVADRLSEDPSVTVLVLEAGPVDEDEEWIRVPFFVGNNPSPPASALSAHVQYDWNLGTEPQTFLDGKTRHYPLGRGLGGGTLINGMLWNRGNIGDYDDWAALIDDDGWGWNSMLQYFKRSETFSADYSPDDAAQYQIHSDSSVHGINRGGVDVSYQRHFYTATKYFYNALNELGVPTQLGDPNDGLAAGTSFLPMCIDRVTKTRADARRTHYDPYLARDNLYVSSGQFVTRLVWDDGADCDGNPDSSVTSTESSEAFSSTSVLPSSSDSGDAPVDGAGGSSSIGGVRQTSPPDPTDPFSSVDNGGAAVKTRDEPDLGPADSSLSTHSHYSHSNVRNITASLWDNRTILSPESNTYGTDGRGRHWGFKPNVIAEDIANRGIGIFNLFPVGNLFDLLKSSAPADWNPHSSVEVHEVTTTTVQCHCEHSLCPSDNDNESFNKKRDADTRRHKRQQQMRCKQRVLGVEFADSSNSDRRIITASRDVILAAGAIHTPLILQHSGVGDSAFLTSLNVSARLDLPGVGNNYQDHYQVASNNHFATNNDPPIAYATNTDANRAEFWNNHSGPWTAGPPNGVAFPSLKSMTDNFTAILGWARSQTSGQHLAGDLDASVIAGYDRQHQLLVAALNDSNRAQLEILNSNAGSFTYSIMKPLSRGQVHARSSDPFDTPVIDPRYGSNPVDLAYLVEAFRFNHRLVHTDALASLRPEENYPTSEETADDSRLLDLIKGGIFTEYHPTGTASMLPLDQGGVVDANLTVYGTANLRIVDSSIMPLIPAAHLQACIYGVAEKAADLIRNRS